MNELTIVRVFDAPRDLVFQTWTDPAHFASWFGPHGFVASETSTDPRPGGAWHSRITSTDDGIDRRVSGVYREVSAPSRLVFTFRWQHPEDEVGETLVTIDFAELAGKTSMTFRQAPFPDTAERDGHIDGWQSGFEDLDRILEDLK
ncbi:MULTISPECIES: SRPBCC domain-containing protein [unclassified Amycolatopsis]|uniref:SRPBCC family protein n=1 Tax=unclassified Amycolatopsis TaxID=2618356 RepID=UPI00106E5E62|nr:MULTISPECIES: SRPBCC domain-containing protein [unclassified Amycolatopsis]